MVCRFSFLVLACACGGGVPEKATSPVAQDPPTALVIEPRCPENETFAPRPSGRFDRGAAAGALGCVDLKACTKLPDTSGQGHVKVTFAFDGTATAQVDSPPELVGTPTAACIEERFRHARIPEYHEDQIVKVGKSFTLH